MTEYQHAPLPAPEEWTGGERVFYARLIALIDELYARTGRLRAQAHPVGATCRLGAGQDPHALFGGTWVRAESEPVTEWRRIR